jgi:hypothetical protein
MDNEEIENYRVFGQYKIRSEFFVSRRLKKQIGENVANVPSVLKRLKRSVDIISEIKNETNKNFTIAFILNKGMSTTECTYSLKRMKNLDGSQ